MFMIYHGWALQGIRACFLGPELGLLGVIHVIVLDEWWILLNIHFKSDFRCIWKDQTQRIEMDVQK